MHIWLVALGEPLPTDDEAVRLLRVGMIFNQALRMGLKVTWWTSSFDHIQKMFRRSDERSYGDDGRIVFLQGCGYKRNISIKRFVDHVLVAREFRRKIENEPAPDVILVAYPTIELTLEAVDYGARNGVPVIVDVRDLWPDAFYDMFPSIFGRLLKFALFFWENWSTRAFARATTIIGITEEFVDWGLARGNRSRGRLDRVFPMAYMGDEDDTKESWRTMTALSYWEDHGVLPKDWIVCFFGTLGRHFDIETVIDGARLLQKGHADIKFVICGDGENRNAYEDMASGISNIVFPGWINKFQIRALMSISKVGLAPYLATKNFLLNLPNKPLEYMSAGLPVVSSIEGVLGHVLTENRCGVIYRNGSGASLKELLVDLHENDLKLQEYSANARRLYKEKFNAKKVYSEICSYMALVANEKNGSKNPQGNL